MSRILVGAASLLLLAAAAQAWLELAPELRDIAARIDYGFYSEDPRIIQAAAASLDRSATQSASTAYYRALAAYRLAQLGARSEPRALSRYVSDCVAGGEAAAKDTAMAAEAWILIAACSSQGGRAEPLKAGAHQRRYAQAIARARAVDPDNARLGLIEVWAASERPGLAQPPIRDQAAAALEAVIERYVEGDSGPGWGEAEALAHLGEIRLARADLQGARDVLEHALLVAPDYRFALTLKNRLSSLPGNER
jgi:hypothetical protein